MKYLFQFLIVFLLRFNSTSIAQDLFLRSNAGHATTLITACFSPDEKYVASLSRDGVKLWDIESAKELYTWKSEVFSTDVLFTPDSRYLILSTQSNAYIVIDIKSKTQKTVKLNSKSFSSIGMAMSPDGKLLAFLDQELITLWDLTSSTQRSQIKIERPVGHVSFSTDSKLLFVGSIDGYYGVLDVEKGVLNKSYGKTGKTINAVRFSSEKKVALVSNTDYSIDLLDMASRSIQKSIFKADFAWTAFDLSADGKYAIVGGTLDHSAKIISLENSSEIRLLGKAGEIKVVKFSPSGKYVLTNSTSDGTIRIWNVASGEEAQLLKGSQENLKMVFSSKEHLIFKNTTQIKVWNLRSAVIKRYALDSTFLCSYITDPTKIYALKPSSDKQKNQYELVNVAIDKTLTTFELPSDVALTDKSECIVSPDESILILTNSDGTFHPFQWIDIKNGVVKKPFTSKFIGPSLSQRFHFLNDGKHVVRFGLDLSKEKSTILDYHQNTISEFTKNTWHGKYTISNDNLLYYTSADGIFEINLLTGKRAKIKGKEFVPPQMASLFLFNSEITFGEYRKTLCYGFENLYIAPLDADKVEVIPSAHPAPINYLNFIAHDSILVSASLDGQVKFWDVQSKKEILELRNPKDEDWVVKTPDGLFDASANEFRELYFVKDQEVVELDQMKSRFYEPYLLQKKLGFSKEVLRKSRGLGQLNMYPSIKLSAPNEDHSKLNILLTDVGGGIGKVSIRINGKEAIEDARKYQLLSTDSTMAIEFPLSNHPFLLQNAMNAVEVIAFNKEEYLQSRPKRYNYFLEAGLQKGDPIQFNGLFVGISDYSGDAMDLRYASTDATSFSQSMKWSAEKQFGLANTHITSLASGGEGVNHPTKENIKNYFASLANRARPQDILMIFLAGHGINYGGEEGDFYFLTAEASSGDLKDPAVRKTTAISSQELTDFIKSVPCLKQVLILDACHAGQYAYDLLASARSEKPASEVRALERIKDRTGLYVLSGSAADAVSYEASAYGQGLLTYSLLFGIKGAALREAKYVDVMNLFQFAADEVPRLAETIGGIQKPEIRVPYGAKSFDVGIVDENIQSRIVLPSPKPLFAKSNFSDVETYNDDLRLSEKTDEFLMGLQTRGSSVVFVNVNRFPNAYSLKGRYSKTGDEYLVQSKLFKGDALLHTFDTRGVNLETIIEKIAENATRYLKEQ